MNASSRFFNDEAFCVRRDACPLHDGTPLPAEHDLGGENAILIGERTCAAGLFCNMLDRLPSEGLG